MPTVPAALAVQAVAADQSTTTAAPVAVDLLERSVAVVVAAERAALLLLVVLEGLLEVVEEQREGTAAPSMAGKEASHRPMAQYGPQWTVLVVVVRVVRLLDRLQASLGRSGAGQAVVDRVLTLPRLVVVLVKRACW